MSNVRNSLELEEKWQELARKAPAEVVSALKEAHAFYDGERILKWLAGLYDPSYGGFYYSNSARDNEPYRPDLESTAFALSLITANGAISNRSEELPAEVCCSIVDFARELQSPIDGYFYHPQWPAGKENLAGDRYGRDLATASHFITSFSVDRDGGGKKKQYPKWCIPGTSAKCELHEGTDGRCSFPIAAPARIKAAATPVVKKPVNKNLPDYSTPETFMAWLESYNGDVVARDDSGNAHNIAELRYEILNYGYADLLLDYLDGIQARIFEEQLAAGEKPTGMFQKSVNYRAVWGFFKYMAIYNLPECHRKIDIKYVPYIVDSYIEIIKMPPSGSYYVNDLMNQWLGIERLVSNVSKYYGEVEVEKIRARMRESAGEMVRNSLEKIRPFKLEDGSFAYNPDGRSIAVIYGSPISWGCREGDLNAVILATNMYRAMFRGFGYEPVPLFTMEQGRELALALENAQPPLKSDEWRTARRFDRESDMRFVKVCGDRTAGDVTLSEAIGRSALKINSSADGACDVNLLVVPMGFGKNVLDTKLLVDSASEDGAVIEGAMLFSYRFTVVKRDGEVYFRCRRAEGDVPYEVRLGKTDSWLGLRIEIRHATRDDDTVISVLPHVTVSIDKKELLSYDAPFVSRVYPFASLCSPKGINTVAYVTDSWLAGED